MGRSRVKFAQAAFAVFFSLYFSLAMVPVSVPFAVGVFVSLLTLIVVLTFRNRTKSLREAAGRVLNGAFNSIGQGRLRDASEVLQIVQDHLREAWSQRIVEIQRAIIAIRRGDMADAEKALDLAIALPLQSFARENAAYQLEGAHALRAFVRASLGKEGPAREDIDHVMRLPASEDALARVALAEALLLEQAGKREELRLLLSEKRTLLLEHTHPRERAIVRAFQRMVRADKASVYRKAEARREKAESEEPTLADWVAKVAPAAATFVRSARPAEQIAKVQPEHALAAPSPAAMAANAEARKQPEAGGFKWVFYAVGGVTAVIGLFTALALLWPQSQGIATVEQSHAAMDGMLPLLLVPIGMLPVVYAVSRGLQWVARVRAEKEARAPRKAHAGAPTEEQLRALTQSPSPVVAAQAWLLLADHAERAADFAGALQAATMGLSRLRDPRDRVAADIVYPDLVSLRAFMLAALGRDAESNAELASLGPAYPHYSRAVFRAGLIAILRRGDLRGALLWIEQGEADLPLSVREESLVDLVRAAVQPEAAGAGEIQRLKDELASMPEVKTWIRTAAPQLLDAFERSTMVDVGLRIDTSGADPEADHKAEEEAAAEMESALAPRLVRS